MNTRHKILKSLIVLCVLVAGLIIFKKMQHSPSSLEIKTVMPLRGTIQSVISTTGTVLPRNRLEVKPPVNGRAEEILVKEGDAITTGQILLWMSSTERAALLDAARGKDENSLKYWQETYKPIPLISPIDGEVIVSKTQPGQSLSTSDAAIVLSDKLIIRAEVDETDIGKIILGQKTVVTLDAYPDQKIEGTVDHLYYESKNVNNVTIYEVDILPDHIPAFFRSGMNASIDFIEKINTNALLIPQEAVNRDKNGTWVLVQKAEVSEPVETPVKIGIANDRNVEILSGITDTDTIMVKTQRYKLPQAGGGTNPFMPQRRR